jgi:hypothetical protein
MDFPAKISLASYQALIRWEKFGISDSVESGDMKLAQSIADDMGLDLNGAKSWKIWRTR